MVNYSPRLAAIHYTVFIIHHMTSDIPHKPEQLLCPGGVREASCNTNAFALTWARQRTAEPTHWERHTHKQHTGALIDTNMMNGCCQFHHSSHTRTSTIRWRRHSHTYYHHQPSSQKSTLQHSLAMRALWLLQYIVSPSIITPLFIHPLNY